MSDKFVCKDCGFEIDAGQICKKTANMIEICPKCRKYIGSISDYGFGPITPCNIYVGNELAGVISKDGEGYRLDSEKLNVGFKLNGKYDNLACYKEAADYIGKHF